MKRINKFTLLILLLIPNIAQASCKPWSIHLEDLANATLTFIIWIGLMLFVLGLIIYINNRANRKPLTGKGMIIGGLSLAIILFVISPLLHYGWQTIVWFFGIYTGFTIFIIGALIYIRNRLKKELGKGKKIIKVGFIIGVIGVALYFISPIVIEKIVQWRNLGCYSSVDAINLEKIDWDNTDN